MICVFVSFLFYVLFLFVFFFFWHLILDLLCIFRIVLFVNVIFLLTNLFGTFNFYRIKIFFFFPLDERIYSRLTAFGGISLKIIYLFDCCHC